MNELLGSELAIRIRESIEITLRSIRVAEPMLLKHVHELLKRDETIMILISSLKENFASYLHE